MSYKDDEFLKKILSKKDDEDDEDDDQNFISESDTKKAQDERRNLFENVQAGLNDAKKRLEGILPESHQQRNLDREVGGLEAKEVDPKIKLKDDVWDKQAQQIAEINEEASEALADASTSTLRKSFIHKQKQQKKREKKHQESAQDSFEAQSHADKIAKNRDSGGSISR